MYKSLFLFFPLFLGGCATMFGPSSYPITVQTIQDDVKIEVQNQVYRSPVVVNLRSAQPADFIFSKECYVTKQVSINREVRVVDGIVLNLLNFPIGYIVDGATLNILKYDTSRPISVDLEKDTTNPKCKDFFNTKKINK